MKRSNGYPWKPSLKLGDFKVSQDDSAKNEDSIEEEKELRLNVNSAIHLKVDPLTIF